MEDSLGKALSPMVICRLDVMAQKSSPSLTFLQNTGVTRRAEHNSWPEQRASAKAPAFPSWKNQHFTAGCTANTQATTRGNQIFEETASNAFQSRVKGNQWIRIVQYHHEPVLKRHKTVYSEWNRVSKHRSGFFFFCKGGGSIVNFPRIIKERLKNTRRRSRPGFFCERILFSLLLKDKKLKQRHFVFGHRLIFQSFRGWKNER